jgi:hypothetical protein
MRGPDPVDNSLIQGILQVKNEFYRLVYIGHPMGGHLSGKIGKMCLGMIETGRVN